MIKPSKTALVLSGGGSRGAYEAGVFLYLRQRFPKNFGRHCSFDVICGTSVGAINGTFFAATLDEPDRQGRHIADAWRSLQIEKMISFRAKDLAKGARLLFSGKQEDPEPGAFRYGGILNTKGLETFVIQSIPWRGIQRNLAAKLYSGLSVSTTHIGLGHTHVFTHSLEKQSSPSWVSDPYVRYRYSHIGPRHVLASAAIPMLFPAVRIGDEYFSDGGLRQNYPLAPAIHQGANKILLISLRYKRKHEDRAMTRMRERAYPKPLFLAGKALNALMLSGPDKDLGRLSHINRILKAGADVYGNDFNQVLNEQLIKNGGAPLQPIRTLEISPSEDIGALASDFVRSKKVYVRSPVAKYLLRKLTEGEASHESDLLSYLMFDGNYAAELVELGYRDAQAQEEAFFSFFSDET